MPDPELEVQDDSITPAAEDGDKSNDNSSFSVEDLPDEEEDLGKKDEGEKPKVEKSEIAQKLKWREKARQFQKQSEDLQKALDELRNQKPASDDKERAAWEVLDKRIEEKLRAALREESSAKDKASLALEERVEETLELHPELKEDELLDAIEEFEVDPEKAARILLRSKPTKKEKPSLPSPKRSSSAAPAKKADDSKKSLFQIAQDVKKEIQERFKK